MSSIRRFLIGAIGLGLLGMTPPATLAQPLPPGPPPPGGGPGGPGYNLNPNAQRHMGFYFRTWLGLGFTRMTASEADAEVSGQGAGVGFAFGGSIQENLILYGEVFDDIAFGPDIRIGGMTGSADDDASAGVIGFGVGLAYYVVPANIYVSATLASSQITLRQNGEKMGETNFGLGISAMLGKEWWVSDSWGLGIAGQVFAGQMEDKGPGAPTWTATAVALALSATYN